MRFLFLVAFLAFLFMLVRMTFGAARLKHWLGLLLGWFREGADLEETADLPFTGKQVLLYLPMDDEFLRIFGQQVESSLISKGATVVTRDCLAAEALTLSTRAEKGFDFVVAYDADFSGPNSRALGTLSYNLTSSEGWTETIKLPFSDDSMSDTCDHLERRLSAQIKQ